MGLPSRTERQLNDEERKLLAGAHAELREAVRAYEPYLGGNLQSGQPVSNIPLAEIRAAQERIEEAEENLWQLREKLLGWKRPSSVPRASLVTDWFSEEDAAYDDVDSTD